MYQMKPLPYDYSALEPYYSQETLRIHYDTLYKGYTDNFNKTIAALEMARLNKNYDNIKCLEKNLAFFGSGYILHTLFFENLAPKNESKPSAKLMNKIDKDFGSYAMFKEQFAAAAINVEASGWCILGYHKDLQSLFVLQCEKHQDLTLWGIIPLLVIDMWEHSYFLQYKANRALYLSNIDNIINWDKVSERFINL